MPTMACVSPLRLARTGDAPCVGRRFSMCHPSAPVDTQVSEAVFFRRNLCPGSWRVADTNPMRWRCSWHCGGYLSRAIECAPCKERYRIIRNVCWRSTCRCGFRGGAGRRAALLACGSKLERIGEHSSRRKVCLRRVCLCLCVRVCAYRRDDPPGRAVLYLYVRACYICLWSGGGWDGW